MIRAALVEIFAILLFLALRFYKIKENETVKLAPHDKCPVLLIHGYLGSASDWIYHRRKIRKDGFKGVYTLTLGSPFHSIEDYADLVKGKVEEIAIKTGRSDIKIVGYSMGGLVALYYTLHIAKKGTINVVVTVGTPLNGTRMAQIGVGECCRQMAYKSPFVQALHNDLAKRPDIHLFSISSTVDEIVVPNTSALCNVNLIGYYTFDNIAHFSYLFSGKVSDKIIAFLNHPI